MLENVCNIVYMYYRNTDYLASSEIKDKFRILHVFLLTMSHLNDFFIEFYEYLLPGNYSVGTGIIEMHANKHKRYW